MEQTAWWLQRSHLKHSLAMFVACALDGAGVGPTRLQLHTHSGTHPAARAQLHAPRRTRLCDQLHAFQRACMPQRVKSS